MLTTLSNLKSYLGITTSADDVFLQNQLDIVSEAVETYCERKFETGSYVQTFYREDMPETPIKDFLLYHYPLKSIASVEERVCPGDAVSYPITDYRFHLPTGRITKNWGVFFCGTRVLEVTYTAGYDNIPAPVLGVIYGIVQERYNKKLNGIDVNFGSDVQRISIPGTISIDYDYSLSSNDRKTPLGNILGNHVNVLDAYRSERTLVGSVRPEYVS